MIPQHTLPDKDLKTHTNWHSRTAYLANSNTLAHHLCSSRWVFWNIS